MKNNWMRQTYIAGALATGGSTTDLVGSNDTAISVGTFLVSYDCELDILKNWSNAASTWQM
jgi:hypothetical protein